MKNKIFLTSIFAIAFACPAMAVDGNATIENGDTCNIDNLGTSENNSTANIEAIWTLQSINCPAGTSFNASTASCDTCASGSWCVAGTYDVENNQTGAGATLCSSLSNGDYPLSASGSSANTACYRNCANADVDHATQVSGAYYYGDNNQCSATECAAGWHIKEGFNLSQYASQNPTNSSYIGINSRGDSDTGGSTNPQPASYFGISEPMEWANDLGVVAVRGIARCSTQRGYRDTVNQNDSTWNNTTTFVDLIDETGQTDARNCYCKLTGYKANGNSIWQNTDSVWMFFTNGNAGDCANFCARFCADPAGYWMSGDFYSVFFDSIQTGGLATCEANNIGLDWYNDTVANNGTKITPNNDAANQCTYNETITVPTNEIQKPGYTFGGWKLRTNN